MLEEKKNEKMAGGNLDRSTFVTVLRENEQGNDKIVT